MKKLLYIFISMTVIFLLSFCSNSISPDEVEVFYFNSFESSNDTIGWKGYIELSNDTPQNGGNKSIRVSGGCIVPHVYFSFYSIEEDCSLIIRFWGKNLMTGGVVSLGYGENAYPSINVFIENKSWYKYTSLDTLFCQASDTLKLCLNSGGFNPSAMLIDNIEIIKVK